MSTTIQWRPEVNSLTIPQSYRIRFMPRNIAGRGDIAADIAQMLPNFSQDAIEAILKAEDDAIMARLLRGEQVTKGNAFSYTLSFIGRVDNPDDGIADINKRLQVRSYALAPFVTTIRQEARTERISMTEKLPVITATEDSLLKLNDVLSPIGLLRVIGRDLLFDPDNGIGQCVLEGTRNGRVIQSRFGPISNTEFLLLPDVPTQTDTWNNEYQLTVRTRYTENGTPRIGIYKRMLRSPLGVRIGDNPGILSGGGITPLVTVSGGELHAEGARLRIQVLHDIQDSELRFSLLDMKEGGKEGNMVRVAGNGVYTLPGYAGAEVPSLEVTVGNYDTLIKMVRNPYGGRLVDILDVSMGS